MSYRNYQRRQVFSLPNGSRTRATSYKHCLRTRLRAPAIKDLDLESEALSIDRALAIHWDVEEDTIKLVVNNEEKPENRKGVLSSIATIYDPLGFASPLILHGREINQELYRLKFDWNDKLPEELGARWKEWRGLVRLHGSLQDPKKLQTERLRRNQASGTSSFR